MERLTQLQQLTASSCFPAGSMLPVQLQTLQLGPCMDAAGFAAAVMPLQQLQHLTLQVCFREAEPLLRLQQLPALPHLSLSYGAMPVRDIVAPGAVVAAVETASAWPQLLQLRELCLSFGGAGTVSEPYAAVILEAIAASTGLTQLQLEGWVGRQCAAAGASASASPASPAGGSTERAPAAPMLPYIADMTQLKELSISKCQLWPAEA
jgi:hypothetical protein